MNKLPSAGFCIDGLFTRFRNVIDFSVQRKRSIFICISKTNEIVLFNINIIAIDSS